MSPFLKETAVCSGDNYKIHLNCLAVQAGVYRDVVECWPVTQAARVQDPARVFGFFRDRYILTPNVNNAHDSG